MGSNQYKLWDPQLDKIIYARDVVIEEWNTIYQEIQEGMRDNPDHDTLGNLVGKEAGSDSDPETPPQSEIARNPDHIDINKVVDKLVGDVEGEEDDQLGDDNYEEEETSDVNADRTEDGLQRPSSVEDRTEDGLQRPSRVEHGLQRPRRVIIPTWKVTENQLDPEELPEFPTTVDLIMLNLTNAIEQLK